MHRIILLLLLSVRVFGGYGQLVRLSGVVVDESTSEPIPFAKVYLTDRTHGAVGDEDGRFMMEGVPLGTQAVIVDAMGYEQRTFQGVEVRPGAQWVEFRLVAPELIGGPPVMKVRRRPWPWRWFHR